MIASSYEHRRRLEALSSADREVYQIERLNGLLKDILPINRFYEEKLADSPHELESLDQLSLLPYTFKEELIAAKHHGDLASNRTYSLDKYVRYHRTSGTRGRPLVVLDTAEDWRWWIDGWQFVLDAAELTPADRVLMAFSFGPFIGFWSANDALMARGCLVIPGGGMSSLARLELLEDSEATAICCTPTYALHLAEVAAENAIDLKNLKVKRIIVAGEPGGSVPAIRDRISNAWHAKVIDHSGASEIGPWGYADSQGTGLYINESEFIAEFRSVDTGETAEPGELSELILTTLGRHGAPVIRYRTGDLVKHSRREEGSNRFVFLEGGVLGRADDMLIIRGVNIFPTSVEQILHSFPEVIEYRMTARKESEMDSLAIELEDRLNEPKRIAKELRLRLGLKIEVKTVEIGSLPRFEGKGKRFIDKR
jgi:phenylacetate-CoA ligase